MFLSDIFIAVSLFKDISILFFDNCSLVLFSISLLFDLLKTLLSDGFLLKLLFNFLKLLFSEKDILSNLLLFSLRLPLVDSFFELFFDISSFGSLSSFCFISNSDICCVFFSGSALSNLRLYSDVLSLSIIFLFVFLDKIFYLNNKVF